MSIIIKRLSIISVFVITVIGMHAQTDKELTRLDNQFVRIRNNNRDSLTHLLPILTEAYLAKGDTLYAAKTLVQSSKLHSSSGNYTSAYDGYWQALRYLDDIKDSTFIHDIYTGLGVLYGLYGRNIEAERYFSEALGIIRKRVNAGKVDRDKLINIYYVMACYHRDLQNCDIAQTYLDTCFTIKAETSDNAFEAPFLQAEQGCIYYQCDKIDMAIDMLLKAEQNFMKINETSLVILYSYLGDAFNRKANYDKSEYYYLKSVEISESLHTHKNSAINSYQKLAELYLKANKTRRAFKYQKLSRELTEKLFDARNENNNSILQIKDEYRLKQRENELSELEQERKILFLRNTVLSICIAFILIMAGLLFWYLQYKRKNERATYLSNQQISDKKNQEILELKNKELTSSAIQLVHKTELLQEIKDTLNDLNLTATNQQLKDIVNKVRINNKQDWKEFDIRFTSVNKDFYKKLAVKFPQLTPKDHKLCALIKLNFSSKEMSQLLGISIDSVNTSRYRLRKKMHLDQELNLTEHIHCL